MPAGLTVINDSGVYQIDENNYSLSVMANGTYNSLSGGIITTTIPNPMFAVWIPQDSNYIGGIGDITLSGSTWSAEIKLFYAIGASPSTANIKWFVLGRPTVAGSGTGMEVYDASGNLKYSTAWKTKAVSTSLNNTKKYAIVGGEVAERVVLNYEQWTDLSWHTYEARFGRGYYCTTGYIVSTEIMTFEQSSSGGGGSNSEVISGNLTPVFGIDVTEYV